MKTREFSKILAVIAILAITLSFASCDLFNNGGALELVSFTVDRTSVKTNYLVGEEIDFSGIKATVKYTDETLNKVYTFDELDITYPEDITASVGDKKVTVSFNDPHLNVKQETKVDIKVTEEPVIEEDPQLAVQFEAPESLTSFNSNNASAGASKYGESGFSGQFAVGDKTYVIGNANEFKLNPQFAVMGESNVEPLNAFFATVSISVKKDGEYAELTQVAGENNIVSYYDGEILIATVDTYNGSYQFSTDAAGKKVKISVLPSEEYYIFDDFNPVVLEAEIINAYNVYEAWQLSVIDNDTSRSDWNDIKTQHGIINLNVAGIVLHNDIKITTEDVPSNFFHTTTADVTYTNKETKEEINIPAGTKYLKEWTEIYIRVGTADFEIQGNFFNIDVSGFPLVPSPGVFGKDAGYDYGTDFSNATLFRFETAYESLTAPDEVADIAIENLSIKGNAKRDNLIDSTEALASAGGLIMIKSTWHCNTKLDNIWGNSFFISYFSESFSTLTATNVKCYDSYQNAGMVWAEASLIFENSFLNGSGGPIVIATSEFEEGYHPTLTLTDTITETHLEGSEIWFVATGATGILDSVKALGTGLAGAGMGDIADANGKMNIKGLLMAKAYDAETIVKGVDAEGSIFFDNAGISRYKTDEDWLPIYQISSGAYMAYGTMPPFFTVNDAEGNMYSIYFNGTTFVDLAGRELGTDASHAAILGAFQAANTVVLTQGGMSVVFELYHN